MRDPPVNGPTSQQEQGAGERVDRWQLTDGEVRGKTTGTLVLPTLSSTRPRPQFTPY
jgi:hypothetical protein